MGLKRECDRCGKAEAVSTTDPPSEWATVNVVWRYPFSSAPSAGESMEKALGYVICHRCREALKEFVEQMPRVKGE